MKVENRHEIRRPLSTSVQIYQGKKRLDIGRVLNISLNGMYIQPSRLGFVNNTPVEVEFLMYHYEHLVFYRLPAKVRHSASQGIGVMFEDIEMDQYRRLKSSIYGAGWRGFIDPSDPETH